MSAFHDAFFLLPETFHLIFPFSFLLFHPLISFCTQFLLNFPFCLHPTPPISPPALPPPSPASRHGGGSANLRPRLRETQLCHSSACSCTPPRGTHSLPLAPMPAAAVPPHLHGAVPTPAWDCPHTCAGAGLHIPPSPPPAPHPHRLTPRSCTPPSRLCPASSGRCFALRRGGSRKDVCDLHVAKADSQMASQLPLYSLQSSWPPRSFPFSTCLSPSLPSCPSYLSLLTPLSHAAPLPPHSRPVPLATGTRAAPCSPRTHGIASTLKLELAFARLQRKCRKRRTAEKTISEKLGSVCS